MPAGLRWPLQDAERVLQGCSEFHDVEVAYAGGRKLCGQRQLIEPAANCGDVGGRLVETKPWGGGQGTVEEQSAGPAGQHVLGTWSGGYRERP